MRHVSFRITVVLFAVCLILPLLPAREARAASAVEIDAKADAALKNFLSKVPAGKELLHKAAGVLIFPSIVKAGMLIGGEYGEGVLRINGISTAYYSTASASVGFQLGVQSRSVIIMFMTKNALNKFRKSNGWEVGVDGSVALVTIGAGGSIDTTTAQEPIIGFIFGQKGLMYNLTLEGSKITKIVR